MNRPIKFLHLTTFYPPYSFGGDAMYIYRLTHALGDEGHEVDVIHCLDSYYLQHPGEPELTYREHPNVHRYGIKSPFGWLSPLITQQTGKLGLKQKAINDIIDGKAYDVIQFHNISLLGPEVMTISAYSQCVKLYMTHEHWLICPMHVLWKNNQKACDKPACFQCSVLSRRPPQLWRYTSLLETTSRYVDRFISPSKFTARMHADRGFSQPVSHLPYFIDKADKDWKTPAPHPTDRPYFLFVGRLEKIKGLDSLIQIWQRVHHSDLLIAGTGSQEKTWKELAKDIPTIRFLGALPQHELGKMYYHATATIVPSRTYETFGIIILESYARKTPVIVNNIGALPEVDTESNGGIVYNDEDDLILAIDTLAADRNLRNELGNNGYQAFSNKWSREAHLNQYLQILDELAMNKYGNIPWN